jgi:hypothetical protein
VVRISGTEGAPFRSFYGTVSEEQVLEEAQGTVGVKPIDYEVEVPPIEAVAAVVAEAEKTEPGSGELRVQILGDDEVFEEGHTLSRLGRANIRWESGEIHLGPGPTGEMFPPEIETTEAVLFEA